ncbi:MAG: cytochrome c3 family protein [Verrucomicrobiota bacterium]
MQKKLLSIVASVSLSVGAASIHAAGTISGTPHDLSGKGWGTTELCKYCHTPHQAQNVSGAPLWNHQSTAVNYTLYSSLTFKGSVAQPGPQSKLCLSCHDGTVASDSFANGGVIQAGTHFMTTSNLVGGSAYLGSDHPISFAYNSALATADGHLNPPASANFADAGSQLPLYSSQLECATCHAVHDNTYGKFLRMANTGSAMCRTCHTQ